MTKKINKIPAVLGNTPENIERIRDSIRLENGDPDEDNPNVKFAFDERHYNYYDGESEPGKKIIEKNWGIPGRIIADNNGEQFKFPIFVEGSDSDARLAYDIECARGHSKSDYFSETGLPDISKYKLAVG